MIKLTKRVWYTLLNNDYHTTTPTQEQVVHVLSEFPDSRYLAPKIKALSPAEFAELWKSYDAKRAEINEGKGV